MSKKRLQMRGVGVQLIGFTEGWLEGNVPGGLWRRIYAEA